MACIPLIRSGKLRALGVREPEIKARLLGLGLEPPTMTQPQFAALRKAEAAKDGPG